MRGSKDCSRKGKGLWITFVRDLSERPRPHWRVLAKRRDWEEALQKGIAWNREYDQGAGPVSICVLWEGWGRPDTINYDGDWDADVTFKDGAPDPWE